MPDLSLQDMLKIMDVAREMRQDRELVLQELSHEERVSRLRERLLASTELTGETATPEEVDAAIELYFDNLHTFREPQFGLQVLLAHLYIRRWKLLISGTLLLALGSSLWWLFLAPHAPLSSETQRAAVLRHQQDELARLSTSALEWASEPAVRQQINQLTDEARLALEQSNASAFDAARRELSDLAQQLQATYEVRIVQSGQSAARRDFTDDSGTRVSGYYVIVEAVTPDGQRVSLPIRDRETGNTSHLATWGEQVPEAVYNRLKADKLADGVLDEHLFARKERGHLDWNMQLPGADGQPLKRGGQIASW